MKAGESIEIDSNSGSTVTCSADAGIRLRVVVHSLIRPREYFTLNCIGVVLVLIHVHSPLDTTQDLLHVVSVSRG